MSIIQGLIASISLSSTYTYSVTPTYTLVDEGVANDFVFSSTNPTTIRLYWSITDITGTNMNTGRFSQVSGSNTVDFGTNTGDTGGITVSADSAISPDAQSYIFRVYDDSGRTNQVASVAITVNDTSTGLNSLSFDGSSSYLDVGGTTTDWNLGTTWTIEYWSKATAATTGGGLYTVMCQAIDGSIDLLYMNGSLKLNNNSILPEPTPGAWTHVALVGTGSQVIAYYNGTSAGVLGGAVDLNNSSDDLVIGKRGPGNFQYFNGNLAMIRISVFAKYSDNFTPSTTYGVEADTKLFLGPTNPLVDDKNHTVDNQGVVISSDFPT